MRSWLYLIAVPLWATAAASAPASVQRPLSVEERQVDHRAVVDEVRRIIAKRYVLPERRPALDAVLAQGLASGRYNVTDPATLAELINEDLERVGRDKHLSFRLNPEQAAIIAARQNEAAPDPSAFERQVRLANHGVTELRLLAGNVRYLDYDGFMWIGPESAAALENAMRFLAGGDAIIIDIRNNSGGDSDASQYLLSHFLPPKKPLYDYYRDGAANPTRVSTLPEVPAGRVTGKPLYLLISNETASAAEEFGGNFRNYDVGEVVGEKTAGAGFAADLVPIDERFILSLSTGRVVLSSTGRDWEAVGIPPTIRTAASQALDTAHAHALRRITAKALPDERPGLEALAEGLSAGVEARVSALPLTAYAGEFVGERTVSVEDGQLYYQRAKVSRELLIPLGENRFAFDSAPGQHLEFVVNGKQAKAVTIKRPDTSIQGTYERTD